MVTALAIAAAQTLVWLEAPALPEPVSNNAVAAAPTAGGMALFSFLGLDSSKRWDGITNRAFRWDAGSAGWREIAPVPGPGRLAATAQYVRGAIYLIGGYTVARDGAERSLPNVDIYDLATGAWRRGADIPVPVDDAVSGVGRDSLIYLVSGWHDRDNVRDVQVYDPARDRWMGATPIPGPPVFGHAGAIAGNTIVYLDGVRVEPSPRRFAIERSAWKGEIDPQDPTRITWMELPDHPGPALYRAAAGGAPDAGWILVAGGTHNPYNYNGIGYNGRPSEPRSEVFGYDVARGTWTRLGELPHGIMDLRGLVAAGDSLFLVGGMESGQRVTRRVLVGRWQ